MSECMSNFWTIFGWTGAAIIFAVSFASGFAWLGARLQRHVGLIPAIIIMAIPTLAVLSAVGAWIVS